MYFPILRSKQYELLALRACKQKLSNSNVITPIIEPVRENSRDTIRCIRELTEINADHIVICNPQIGEYAGMGQRSLNELIEEIKQESNLTKFAFCIHEETSVAELRAFEEITANRRVSLIHQSSYEAPEELSSIMSLNTFDYHFFIEQGTSRNYRRQFPRDLSVNIQDRVRKVARNADYANHPNEFFSDQHLTFQDDGLLGFGDFTILGDFFREGGGQAHVAAIHISYEQLSSNEIWIQRFLSGLHTVALPASELINEALMPFITFIEGHPEILEYSDACRELIEIHEEGRATNLGYIKKLIVWHHLELVDHLLSRN